MPSALLGPRRCPSNRLASHALPPALEESRNCRTEGGSSQLWIADWLRGKTPARVAMVHMGRAHDIQHLGNSDQCMLRQVAHEDLGQARVGALVGWVRQAARRTGGDYVPGYSADLTTSLDELFLVKDARGKALGAGSLAQYRAGGPGGGSLATRICVGASLTSPELLERTLAEVGWREDGASALLASTTTTRQVDFNSSLC